MRLLKQLEFIFRETDSITRRLRRPPRDRDWSERREGWGQGASKSFHRSRDVDLETKARQRLSDNGAAGIASALRVEWNPRLQTCAGLAHFRERLISLNPRLCDHGAEEIDRTLRHELAHLLAQFRAGRRRILPHGEEWRDACRDLGIGDEVRCHNLPFQAKTYAAHFVYRCPSCQKDFPRVRRVRRAVACLACCRK